MADADETIIIETVLKGTADVVRQLEEQRKEILAYKAIIQETAKSTKESIDLIVQSILKLSKPVKPTKEAFTSLGGLTGTKKIFDKEAFQQAQEAYKEQVAAYNEMKERIKIALKELKEEEKNRTDFVSSQVKERVQLIKEATQQETVAEKLSAQQIIEAAREKAKIQRELELSVTEDRKKLAEISRRQANEAALAYAAALEKQKQAHLAAAEAARIAAEKNDEVSKKAKENAIKMAQAADVESVAAKKVAEDAKKNADALDKSANSIKGFIDSLTQLGTSKLQGFLSSLGLGQVSATAVASLGKIGVALGILLVAFNAVKNAVTSLINLLRSIPTFINNITEAGVDFAKTMFRAAVAVNTMRMRGLNVSIEETVTLVRELRKEFGALSEKEALGIISTTQLLTRNLGFTSEMLENVIRLSTALAIVQGKDVLESARQLVLFFSSGYGEGLQKAGISVNRFLVAQKAIEMGLGTSYAALTEQERALAAYTLAWEQANDILAQAAQYQKTLPGQIEKAQKEIETQTTRLSLAWLPLKKVLYDFILFATKVFITFVSNLTKMVKDSLRLLVILSAAFFASGTVLKEWAKGQINSMQEMSDRWVGILKSIITAYEESVDELGSRFDLAREISDMLDISGIGKPKIEIEPVLDDEALKSLSQDLVDLQQDLKNKLEEITAERDQKILSIDAQFKEDDAEIWRDLGNDILAMQAELEADITKLHEDLANDIADVQRDMQTDLADAARKYRYNEWKAERDFQEKMLRLREQFLFDLEDALRERDAVQIMRLYRQYALDKTQTTRQYEMEKEERRRAYQEELADIRRQAQLRIAELKREAAQREAELRAQYIRERDEAIAAAKAKDEALKAERDREKEEAQAEWEQEMNDVQTWLVEQLSNIIQDLMLNKDLASDQVDGIVQIFSRAFASDSELAGAFSNFKKLTDQAVKDAQANVDAIVALEGQINAAVNAIASEVLPGVTNLEKQKFGGVDTEFQKKFEFQKIITITPELDQEAVDKVETGLEGIKAPETPIALKVETTPTNTEIETSLSEIKVPDESLKLNVEVVPEPGILTEELTARKDEAKLVYDLMYGDLQSLLDRETSYLRKRFGDQYNITRQFAQRMASLLRAYFGPRGVVESIYKYLLSLIQLSIYYAQQALNQLIAMTQQAQALANSITSSTSSGGTGGGSGYPIPHQTGGYVGKGMSSLGEGGYEFVINNPTTRALEYALGEKLSQEKLLAAVAKNEGGGIGKAVIEVWLSPGLEGEIVDKAMGEVADVLDTVIRRR